MSVRTLQTVLFLAAVGCGAASSGPGAPPEKTAPTAKKLTEDQRIRWEKTRRQAWGVEGQKYASLGLNVAGYFIDRKQWLFSEPSKWSRKLPQWDAVSNLLHHLPPAETAQKAAAAASEERIRLVAVVDLYSKADPFVVTWYYDDGKGAKEYKACPRKELEASLAAHLYDLQTFSKELER